MPDVGAPPIPVERFAVIVEDERRRYRPGELGGGRDTAVGQMHDTPRVLRLRPRQVDPSPVDMAMLEQRELAGTSAAVDGEDDHRRPPATLDGDLLNVGPTLERFQAVSAALSAALDAPSRVPIA
jgi:hypothetical protein